MHVLLEEVGALVAAVAVEDSEVAAARPAALEVGLGDVHDDGDAVLVVVLHQPVERVHRVPLYRPVRTLDEPHALHARHPSLLTLAHPIC